MDNQTSEHLPFHLTTLIETVDFLPIVSLTSYINENVAKWALRKQKFWIYKESTQSSCIIQQACVLSQGPHDMKLRLSAWHAHQQIHKIEGIFFK